MNPDIKLEEHAGCGGISVVVPSGSVYGGSVLFCLKCGEDVRKELEKERDSLRLDVKRMRLALGAIKAWCSRHSNAAYAERLAMAGLGEAVEPPCSKNIGRYDDLCGLDKGHAGPCVDALTVRTCASESLAKSE